MIITIITIIITVAPFLYLAHSEGKEMERKRKEEIREIEERKNAFININISAIERRWPFISLWELYHYKKFTDPSFDKPISPETWHELRIEHGERIKRHLKRE